MNFNFNALVYYTTMLTIVVLQILFVCNQYTGCFTTDFLYMLIADEWGDVDISISLCGGKVKFGLYYDADYIDYSNPNLLTVLA